MNKGLAERQGFEPWVRKRTTVFETAPFDHSGISPLVALRRHTTRKPRNLTECNPPYKAQRQLSNGLKSQKKRAGRR